MNCKMKSVHMGRGVTTYKGLNMHRSLALIYHRGEKIFSEFARMANLWSAVRRLLGVRSQHTSICFASKHEGMR